MQQRKNRSQTLALTVALVACDNGGEATDPPVSQTAPQASDTRPTGSPLTASEPVPAAPRAQAPVEPTGLTPGIQRWLRSETVIDDAFARGVLYSWTSDDTSARMRRDRSLFDDNTLPEGPTPYVQRLEHIASRKGVDGRLARALLGHPDLARRRYAWSSPWPTRLGLVRPYGAHLIRIELRPRALVGRFDPSSTPVWTFHDLDQRPVPLARVMADPSRVGAIYHVRRDAEPHFREYVLCNESMVASWSLDTPELAELLADDARRLRELATLPPELVRPEYAGTLAFALDRYQPTPPNLTALADALALPSGSEPLRVTPRRRFRRSAAPALVKVRQLPPRLEDLI